jgi:enoyl-CoA hydratase/carnithine racemase
MNELVSHAEGDLLVLAFNRPAKANALNEALQTALVEKLSDPHLAAKAVVLTAMGERVWSAGADLKEFSELERGVAARKRRALLKRTLEAVARFRKPLVAAVQGKALGAGAMIALLADELVMAEGAELGLPEIHHGIPTPVGYAIVAARAGMPMARRMVQDGEPIGAKEAVAFHLADDVSMNVRARAMERAKKLAAASGPAYETNKAFINAPLLAAIEAAFAAADQA